MINLLPYALLIYRVYSCSPTGDSLIEVSEQEHAVAFEIVVYSKVSRITAGRQTLHQSNVGIFDGIPVKIGYVGGLSGIGLIRISNGIQYQLLIKALIFAKRIGRLDPEANTLLRSYFLFELHQTHSGRYHLLLSMNQNVHSNWYCHVVMWTAAIH